MRRVKTTGDTAKRKKASEDIGEEGEEEEEDEGEERGRRRGEGWKEAGGKGGVSYERIENDR